MDKISQERRSENMRRITSRDTKPEMAVRRAIYKMGFRYRLHRKDLPGNPDIVLSRLRKAVFVHGCFWHNHDDPRCVDGRIPKSRREYWLPKLSRNKERDAAAIDKLSKAGWSVLVIWECEVRDLETLSSRVGRFLRPGTPIHRRRSERP